MTQTFFVSSSTMIAIGHLAFLLSHTLISVPVQYMVASATAGDANSNNTAVIKYLIGPTSAVVVDTYGIGKFFP
jgi:hypothetical protein